VCLPGSQAGVRKRQPKRAQRPHSKFSDRKALDGPAMRPTTPLAVENGVGKLAANARQIASAGKRVWRTPTPHLSLFDRKVRQGLIVFNTQVPNDEIPKEISNLKTKSMAMQNVNFEIYKGSFQNVPIWNS
jgi:hypothetical protein